MEVWAASKLILLVISNHFPENGYMMMLAYATLLLLMEECKYGKSGKSVIQAAF